MIDSKPIVDAVLAQLVIQITPAVADAVVAHIRQASQAEGAAILALEPSALEEPMKTLITSDNSFTEVLGQCIREEARDAIGDMDLATTDSIDDQVHTGVRAYLRDHLDDMIDSVLANNSDFVREHDVEDYVDLNNFDDFTELRDEVEELKRRIDSERPDTPSPFYREEDNRVRPEFAQAVRDALRHIIINQDC